MPVTTLHMLKAVKRYGKILSLNKSFCLIHTISRKMSTMPKVLITRGDIPKEALEMFTAKCDLDIWSGPDVIPRAEFLKKIKGKDALYCMLTEKIDKELLDNAGPTLKVIGTMSVGYDHIDLSECKKRGIKIGNTPGILTNAVAELTIALLLSTSRRLMEATKEITNGGWEKCTWSPLWMCGCSISGSTVGIVGLGRIGFAVAERLKGFKVEKIVYTGNTPKPYASDIGAEFMSLENLLTLSDFIIVCCALTEKTKGLFDKQAFSKMKNTAIFINTSRGAIVNQEDLYEALTNGQIRAAGLDVMMPEPLPADHKLTKLKNCVLLPHIGSADTETRISMAKLTVGNILAGLDGRPLPCPL